ncbi:hypothetical protein IT575_12355 [bacterium]|nr:hypothetical protein [bacterium]
MSAEDSGHSGPGGEPGAPARRHETLEMLRQSLADWERDVDWEGLSETQRSQLIRLAEESAATLRSMIERLEREAAAGRPAGGEPRVG